ncbi:Hsp20/alpha crystallin family protein [Streptomyces himalayensis]|uniref:Hsp20/alpha crystallin family protein n=2 Tax=Streptomyces himalayensis TaxID=2820085 RepID=A0A7W2HGR9_9ACTN|nr:Hsp20/alpha crystallin family protein [Streptomyces himalayensis]MBA2947569.1 Hsp20/alpha crystallin family protein [Streptomyces himalayensis subsp. himalayensis]MBA4863248.1 Hsp20/alpha crystallin family protein [Streptomyces himalayensis subsp. aureolus]
MTLPVRRGTPGRLAERRFPGWARDPLAEFDDLFGRIGSLLESTVGGTLTPVTEGMAWSPLADVSETDDAYLIEIDVPGVKREDIDIEMGERDVTVRGEFKEREGAGTLRRGTRRTGRFEYRTLLPGDVNTEEVNAALRDGVLTITVPKAETTKPRHIEITAGD